MQAGDPTFGAGLESRHVGGGEGEAHRTVEERGSLLAGEAQVRGAQLRQLPLRAQPREGQARVLARGDDDVKPAWSVLDQERDGRVDRTRVDGVEVVEDQDDGLAVGVVVELVEQRREDRFMLGAVRRLGHRERLGADGRRRGPQRGDEVPQEAPEITVGLVEREPRTPLPGPAARVEPVGHQRRLAETCGSRDKRQPVVQAGVEAVEEAPSGHTSARPVRDVQFRGSDRAVHHPPSCTRSDDRMVEGGLP